MADNVHVAPDNVHVAPVTAEQWRQRARLLRYTAEAVRSGLLRQDLLEIAGEYESLAERTAKGPSSIIDTPP
jgi:hypothetical protein